MARISLNQVTQRDGAVERLADISLDIEDCEFLVIVGPSGSGKTSLLRLIAGLEPVSGGEIRIDGVCVNQLPAERRGLAMVFQSHALFPHLSVAANLGFAPRWGTTGAGADRAARVARVAALLGLEPLLGRKPDELSAGERQRVAIGRAIAAQPRGYLFDEALANLDPVLRAQLRLELVALNRQLQTTMIYVTHDQAEAMIMADRVVVLNGGRIEQVATPRLLHDQPANQFVAGFIGAPPMNFIAGRIDAAGLVLAEGITLPCPTGLALGLPPGLAVTLGVRPEHVSIAAEGGLRGYVTRIEHLGFETHIHLRLSDARWIMRGGPDCGLRVGETVPLAIDPTRLHWFGADGVVLERQFD